MCLTLDCGCECLNLCVGLYTRILVCVYHREVGLVHPALLTPLNKHCCVCWDCKEQGQHSHGVQEVKLLLGMDTSAFTDLFFVLIEDKPYIQTPRNTLEVFQSFKLLLNHCFAGLNDRISLTTPPS